MGISIGAVTQAGVVTSTQKIWRSLQALGAMAFAYSFSIILIEIQVIQKKNTYYSHNAQHCNKKAFWMCCRTP